MRGFDLVCSPTALYKLVEGAVLLGEYLIGHDVILAENGVDVLDELHGDDFVGELVVVLVEVLGELEVQDQGVSVLGLDVVAVLYCYLGDLPQFVACADVQSLNLRLLALRFAIGTFLLHLRQQAVNLRDFELEAGPLLLLVLDPEDLFGEFMQTDDDVLLLDYKLQPALLAEGLLECCRLLGGVLRGAVDELLVVLAGGEGDLILDGGGELSVEEVLEDVAVLG